MIRGAVKEAGALARFRTDRATLISYLHHKADQGDWHAVSDAANDLRVLEAAEAIRLDCARAVS